MQVPDSLEPQTANVPRPEDGSRRRGVLFPLVLAALGLLVVWFAWRNYSSFQWVRFAKTFGVLHLPWLFLGAALTAGSVVARAVRWQIMMLPTRSSFWGVTYASYVGFSAIVLFGRAGELVRPYLIARRENTPIAAQAGVWVLERLYDFIAVLLLFGLGINYARNFGPGAGSQIKTVLQIGGWAATGCAALVVALFYLMAHKPVFFRARLSGATSFLPPERHAQFLRTLDSFLKGVQPAGHWPTFGKSMIWTVVNWAMILGGGYCYFLAFPPASGFTILDIAAYWGFVSFGSIVQLPGIGGGMQIASVVILTGLFRMSVEQAAGLSLLIWAGTTWIVLPIGIPLALHGGLNFRKLRRIGKEASL